MDEYKKLWLNVVIQALEDLVNGKTLALQAEAWFRGNSTDYKEVCNHAELNSTKLRRIAILGDKNKLKVLIDEYRSLM